jgi:hypothetical protein
MKLDVCLVLSIVSGGSTSAAIGILVQREIRKRVDVTYRSSGCDFTVVLLW